MKTFLSTDIFLLLKIGLLNLFDYKYYNNY